MSSSTSTWPSQAALAPMPMVGMAMLSRDLPRQRFGDRLDHDREGAGFRDRLGVVLDRLPAALLAALRAERAERVDRLRRQADMAHHGNAALGQERDVSAIRTPPSSLTAPQWVSFKIRTAE